MCCGQGFLRGVLLVMLDDLDQIRMRRHLVGSQHTGHIRCLISLRSHSHLCHHNAQSVRVRGTLTSCAKIFALFGSNSSMFFFGAAWIDWFIRPRCAHLGVHATIMSPWYVDISGPNISIGSLFLPRSIPSTSACRSAYGAAGSEKGALRWAMHAS